MPDLIPGISDTWQIPLAPVRAAIAELGGFLRQEIAAGKGYLPPGPHVLRAFQSDFNAVKVLIVGQDPYPTPGHAIGLSFAVSRQTQPLPRSLQNIYRELQSDLQIKPPVHGDLSAWSGQGVLLLNRVLTVSPGAPGSHRGKGWEKVTDQAIRALAARTGPLVAILWGKDAQNLAPLLAGIPLIESPHPSPMSADRGFFGSHPFSRANRYLAEVGSAPVDWRL